MAVIKALAGSKSLKAQLSYLEKEGKTLEELKQGINCTSDNIEKEFNIVKTLHNKKDGKQYYHYTQSFNPNDNITPEKAHDLGKEWIENNIKGHQIYLVTHVDKGHIHNHFIINSVGLDNGKKLQINPKKLDEMKRKSNRICEREGLSTINLDKKKEINRTDAEYRIAIKGETSWKGYIRECIDFAIGKTKNLEELRQILLEKFNIETRETKNTISYRGEENKPIRGSKLGDNYTKKSLQDYFKNIEDYKEISNRIEGNNTKIKSIEDLKEKVENKEKAIEELRKDFSNTSFIQLKKRKSIQEQMKAIETDINDIKNKYEFKDTKDIDSIIEKLKNNNSAYMNKLREIKSRILNRNRGVNKDKIKNKESIKEQINRIKREEQTREKQIKEKTTKNKDLER